MLRFVTLALATLIGAACLAAAIWIYAPAPTPYIEIQAVRFSEHSLQLTLVALLGLAIAIAGLRAFGSLAWHVVPLAINLVALGLSFVPAVQAGQIAIQNSIPLDPLRTLRSAATSSLAHATITYDHDANGQPLAADVYSPTSASTRSPAVIVVHGGGWSDGARTDYVLWHEWLAQHGVLVFAIDYQLRPQPNWPEAALNVEHAVEWVRANATSLGVDPQRIALLGRSAGGNLALLAAYAQPGIGALPALPEPVQGVVALYAPTDLEAAYQSPVNLHVYDVQESLDAFLGGDPESVRDNYAAASPVDYVRFGSRLPPTLLVQGGRDQLVQSDQMYRLADALRRTNADAQAVELPYAQHAFDLPIEGWSSQLLESMLLRFLGRTVGVTQ